MAARIKKETIEPTKLLPERNHCREVVSLSSSSSSSDYFGSSLDGSDDGGSDVELIPKRKRQRMVAVLPVGFLDPIRPAVASTTNKTACSRVDNIMVGVKKEPVENAVATEKRKVAAATTVALVPGYKQFWKAGDYEGSGDNSKFADEDMDHLRVHPKFLHSNATSHKWALGAIAELLDNSLDEYCNGATYVRVDVLENSKDKSKMVMVQDNGGGMTPDKMRRCMSLGYSAKSKMENTIGKYGNGFKTSTMRLGADVIVFSRSQGKFGGTSTQSIGLLSFTFLRGTGKEDIVVPMIDYERKGRTWSKYVKSSSDCWQRNLETIVQWSPYETEEDLLQQFNFINKQGTRIIIYNLWEDEEGSPEMDFDTDPHDIQIRGDDRDDKKIESAQRYPSCRHFLTYRHSLRSYASILYCRIPPGFRIILRGKEVEHHNIIDDLIHTNDVVYKPAAFADMSANVTLGFVKDAIHHIDVQGFNVYHKNRLIKPFWRVWSAAGSDGRGVVGVLEANFVEPAHDKQGFERTIALSRLEARLLYFQKIYWSSNCQLIGYAQRRHAKKSSSPVREASPSIRDKSNSKNSAKSNSFTSGGTHETTGNRVHRSGTVTPLRTQRDARSDVQKGSSPLCMQPQSECPLDEAAPNVQAKMEKPCRDESVFPSLTDKVVKLKQENESLRRSLQNALQDLKYEKDKNNELENQLEHTRKMMATMDKEQETFVSTFSEERGRRDQEEQNLRNRLRDATETVQKLENKVKEFEAVRNLH